jgi:type II secretory pathway pseudopilin PulG
VLVVIAVVAVLAAITLSISGGAREKAAQNRARSELAVLSTALERYRSVYGSYPQDEQDPEGLL